MINPWENIDLAIYEQHMTAAEVYQMQVLSQIMKEQMVDYDSSLLGICGIAGGNGLDHIDLSRNQKIYAMDINAEYLEVCGERYRDFGQRLELIRCDLASPNFVLPLTTLLIGNLIIEYIGVSQFVKTISRNHDRVATVSCVIQNNRQCSFVSNSALTKHFEPLSSIHHDIDARDLTERFQLQGYRCVFQKHYELPNGKEFIRMDFHR